MSNATHSDATRNGVPAAPADLAPLAPTAGPSPDGQGAGLATAIAQQLAAPLDPSLVAQRKGRAGHTFPYLPGHVAIAQANRLLGFGGWGYDLVGEVTPRDITTRDAQTGAVEHTTAYTATVRLTVPGVPPRTDVGFQVVAEESAQGHETAYKGAVTDALKRALRTLGAQFGNDLAGDGGNGAADTWATSLRQTLLALGAQQGFDATHIRAAVRQRLGQDLDAVPAAALLPLVERAARKLVPPEITATERRDAAEAVAPPAA